MANIQWIPVNVLEKKKIEKIQEMNDICEQKIVEGFLSSNGHYYRTNRDDQINMIGQKDALLADPSIVSVQWKTEDMGYIDHTREEWLQVYGEAFTHKKTQLFKYNTLKQQIQATTTIEEIDLITWQ